MRFRSAAVSAILAASAFPSHAGSLLDVEVPAAPDDGRWSDFLPLMKDEAVSRGYELPRPFGVGAIYNYLERDVVITDTRLSLGGGPATSVSDFLTLGSKTKVDIALGRFDVWVLPFMNLYLIAGNVYNDSTTDALVTLPNPIPGGAPLEYRTQFNTEIDGFVGGLGINVAAGYKNWFISGDVNYSQTDMGFDDSFKALVAGIRTGWHGEICNRPCRFWVGAMYWDTANTAESTVRLPNGQTLAFQADQGPRNEYNLGVGTSVVFSHGFEGFAEYGFNFDDVKFVATGLTYRF
ncbi:hypothetical protein [Haloferula sp.]|uniref:hypothetical protein n=1 Tax=Haloferula sp. TaxID=2497595 RepID=UPI00329CCCF0